MDVFMYQWFRVSASVALLLGSTMMADARGGMAGVHGGSPTVHHSGAERLTEARRSKLGSHVRQQAFASAGVAYGYGLPVNGTGYDPEQAISPSEGADRPEPLPYIYNRALQLTCIRPRLIVLGRPAHESHLPRVVYGTPLPCGFRGVLGSSQLHARHG